MHWDVPSDTNGHVYNGTTVRDCGTKGETRSHTRLRKCNHRCFAPRLLPRIQVGTPLLATTSSRLSLRGHGSRQSPQLEKKRDCTCTTEHQQCFVPFCCRFQVNEPGIRRKCWYSSIQQLHEKGYEKGIWKVWIDFTEVSSCSQCRMAEKWINIILKESWYIPTIRLVWGMPSALSPS